MGKLFKIATFFTGCTLLMLLPRSMVWGTSFGDICWQSLETKYTVIRYQSLQDLEKFNRRIDYCPGQWGLSRLFSNSGSQSLSAEVAQKVDALYLRAQMLLGMHKKVEKVNINIYPDEKELYTAYLKVHDIADHNYQPAVTIRAWYTYKSNTIYLNKNDLHEGMLAHEMAHSIIEHYLLIRLPRASHEILAQYVDSHLFY